MLKIMEVHSAEQARGEYIVLQNLGVVTVSLRGWALCTDAYLDADPDTAADQMFIFRDDIPVKPYTRVVLFTGYGEDGWEPTVDGGQAYCAHWNRKDGIWTRTTHIHILHILASKPIHKPVAIAAPVAI